MQLFHPLLPPFKEKSRAKPRDMRLIAPEAPPWSLALKTAVEHVLIAPLSGGSVALDSLWVGAATLVPIIAFSVWSRRRLAIFAPLLGVGAGLLMGVTIGQLHAGTLEQLLAPSWFAWPGEYYRPPVHTWEVAASLPLVLIALTSAIDHVAVGILIDKINDAQWRRADLAMIGRLLNGAACCHLLSALSGTTPIGLSTANLGLVQVTAQLPPSQQPILGSGLMVGTLCAIGLNLLFRIGFAQQGSYCWMTPIRRPWRRVSWKTGGRLGGAAGRHQPRRHRHR